MNKKEEIEDSLEFCKDIRLYKQQSNNRPHLDEYSNASPSSLREYIDWLTIIDNTLNNPNAKINSSSHSSALQTMEVEVDEKTPLTIGSKSIRKEAYSFALCIIIAISIAYFVTTFIGQHTKVEGSSMEATLQNNDYLIIDKLSYRLSDPTRFDIIVFPFDKNTYYVKRIIGMPGERVQISDGEVYINDVLLRDVYGKEKMKDPGDASIEIKLGADEYFVLGDNRNDSKDSRKAEVGLIKKNKIIGKALFRFFPFNKIGVLKH